MNEEKNVEALPESPEEKKAFARSQYNFLKEKGVTSRMRRSRIFKAAGPGQVQEAWKLATCENWEKDPIRKDLLECILCGSGSVKYGRENMEKVLALLDFPVPPAPSERAFFRVLDGAMEILVPGSFPFSKREMSQIKSGLKKRIYEDDE